MISRFFIDRPIFATVISVVITLAGGVAVFSLPVAQYPEVTPPTVSVTASYPGANAQTVRDTVAAPIEAQVSGVEGMLFMSSQCTNDGAFNLTVTFKMGMNSDMAQVLVQNRVSLALPVIPPLVQNEGISVKKMSPNTMMIVNLISPDRRYDSTFLSNYATIYIKDELGRLGGVAGINYLGQRDYSLRVWLDPEKLAALNMTAMDIVASIGQQNVQVAAGQIGQQPVPKGQQFQLTINTLGRLTDPEQFSDIIVKAAQDNSATRGKKGPAAQATGIVRLRDVVRENKYCMRFQLDAQQLAQRDLTVNSVLDGLRLLDLVPILDPEGEPGPNPTVLAFYRGQHAPLVQEVGDTKIPVGPSAETVRLGDLVLKKKGIEHLETRDEEGVQLGSQQYDQSCTLDGKPSVALSIFQLPGSNALETASRVYAKMEELSKRFPEGLEYKIVYDTTPFIRESVNEVFHTLRDAVFLVAIVVLLFLQDWRAMILPMIDVPVSLIGTFAIMAAMGFTLNNLTLFGLVLAIGIVVDDAIVVLENIERLIATGLDARTATIKAMEEITGPIMAITLVLTSVFVPCCFLAGITGQFFRQFAVTIAVSTIISAINAITMTPSRAVLIFQTEEGEHAHKREALPWWIFGVFGGMLTAWLGPDLWKRYGEVFHLEIGTEELSSAMAWLVSAAYFTPGALIGGGLGWLIIRPVNWVLGGFFRAFNRLFDQMTLVYGKVVSRVLRLTAAVLLLYGGLLVLTAHQFITAPEGFIPQQDKGYLILNVQLPDAASVDRTQAIMATIESMALDTPGVEHTVGVSGQSLILKANAPNLGSMYVMLKEFNLRRGAGLSADEIAVIIQEKCLSKVPDAIVSVFGAPPIDGLGATGGFKIIIEDRGNQGMETLQKVSDRIVERGNKTPGLKGLYNASRVDTPWVFLEFDRSKCMALNVPINDVFSTLQIYLGSFYVNNFNEFGRTWQVNVQADQRFRNRIEDILQLQVRNAQGQMIRLGTLMQVRNASGPVMVMRYNMYSAAAITGSPQPGVSSGEAIALMQEVAAQEMPQAMAYEWTDLTYLQLQAGNTAMSVFGLAVVFVFLVLAAQYESWSLPLAVILVVPMCLLCSIVGVVWYGQMEVTLFTQIGFVVLVGLASKNAILIVEFAKQQRDAGVGPREAILEACQLRLRPILMTSFAFIFGVVPLVISEGAGAEMRRSLGLAVFSGMLGVTLFGIFLTPVFFYAIQWFEQRGKAKKV